MTEKFEAGHWYRWCKGTKRGASFMPPMDFILDGKPRKCLSVTPRHSFSDAAEVVFEGDPYGRDWLWDFEDFEEVPVPVLSEPDPALSE